LSETVLFNEEFFVYIDEKSSGIRKKYLLPREIDINQLWLLEEGHCMRNQVFNLCELKKHDSTGDKLHYEAGSIETLINLVDNSRGITIVPLLATRLMKPAQKKKLRQFAAPRPVREISLVTMNDFPRKTLLENMRKIILASLPSVITDAENRKSMVKMKKLPVNN
jgi:LysR family hydrogen peroxide-inducible transcriptional activator